MIALPLADVGPSGWRLVYLVSLVWCLVALDLARAAARDAPVPAAHITRTSHGRRSTAGGWRLLAAVAVRRQPLHRPGVFFQNRYLNDVRGFSGGSIALFTLATATPAGVGLIVGGRSPTRAAGDALIAVALPVSTVVHRRGVRRGRPVDVGRCRSWAA